MKKRILLLASSIALASCASTGPDFVKLTQSIDKSFGNMPIDGYNVAASKIRRYMNSSGKLDFINYSNDTVYVIHEADINTGNIATVIWDSKSVVSSLTAGKVEEAEVKHDFMYNKRLIDFIEAWDTTQLRLLSNNAVGDAGKLRISRVCIQSLRINVQSLIINNFTASDDSVP